MFSGPMFRREFKASPRWRGAFWGRSSIVFVLSLLPVGACWVAFESGQPRFALSAEDKYLWLGRIGFVSTFTIGLVVQILIIAGVVGASVAEERDKDTISWLLLTRLSSWEIVVTKAAARGLAGWGVMLACLPLLVGSAALAGLEVELVLALVIFGSTAVFVASVAILGGVQQAPVAAAQARAMTLVAAWLVFPPVLTVAPVQLGTIWGDLLAEIKQVAAFLAPLSPLSLATDPAWFYRPRVVSLEGRVALMVAMQLGASLGAILLAARRLHPTAKPPGWGDPTRGYRARCGDDPIFWREYLLPDKRGGEFKFLISLRYLWITFRSFLSILLKLAAAIFLVAIPITVLLATIYYGSAALREWYGGSGKYANREQLNYLIRFVTAVSLFGTMLSVPAMLSGRFMTERDKKTWDIFLTTPLTGGEIIRSKMKVAALVIWQPVKWMSLIWVVGVASGALMPLGILGVVLDFGLILWVSAALGVYWGVQPIGKDALNNRILLAAIAITVLHAPMLLALIMSPFEFARLRDRNPLLMPLLLLAGPAVATLTAGVAGWLTWQTIHRFEEWVGRPVRPSR